MTIIWGVVTRGMFNLAVYASVLGSRHIFPYCLPSFGGPLWQTAGVGGHHCGTKGGARKGAA